MLIMVYQAAKYLTTGTVNIDWYLYQESQGLGRVVQVLKRKGSTVAIQVRVQYNYY